MKIRRALSIFTAVVIMTGIIGVSAAAEDNEIYFTDFDGYSEFGGEYISQTLENMSSPYGKFSSGGASITGSCVDEEHGTSMRFDTGDWKNTTVGLPTTCRKKTLISFDFYMSTSGTMRILSDNGNGFFGSFMGTSAKPEANNGTTIEAEENVISLGKWVNVEFYVDYEADMFIFYADGCPIGAPHELYGSKKPVSSIQFQKRSGGVMFIDNFTVTEVDEIPHMEPITLSISAPGGAVAPSDDSVRLKFSNAVNSESFDEETITVYDETNGVQMKGLEFSQITSTGVTIGFGGQLKEDTDYRIYVNPEYIMGTFGQTLAETEISFYTTGGTVEVTEQLLFSTDFDSQTDSNGNVTEQKFDCGAAGYPNFRFTNWGATGPEGNTNAETGYCVGDTVDGEHGTSLKLIDTYADTGEMYKSVTATVQLAAMGQNKCVVAFDFYTDKSATNPVSIIGEGFSFSLSGNRAKLADIADGSLSWLDGVCKTGVWNTAEIYIDYDEGYVCAYINGKKIEQTAKVKSGAQQLTNVTINTYCSNENNHSDWWFDNLSVTNVKYPLHSQSISLSLSVDNNTMEQESDSVYLKFSDTVKTTYLTSSYIKVEELLDGETRNVPITLTEPSSKQVKITFGKELNPLAKYRVVVDNSVEGLAGNGLDKNYVNLYPYSDDIKVNNVSFYDYFGDMYDYGTIPAEIKTIECNINKNTAVTPGEIKLLDENGQEKPISVVYIQRRNIIKIMPTTMLKGNSSYTLVVGDTIVSNGYRQSFNTSAGKYALGDVLVEGVKSYKSDICVGDNVTVTADIINTAGNDGQYTILIGEYSDGLLNAFHKREMTISASEYSKTETVDITALSDCDEIKAFVWAVKENGSPITKLK